jgi:hypothetical protein
MQAMMRDELEASKIVDRSTFDAELDALRVREKAHTREGDAIAAARRRLLMVEVYGATPLIGERGAVTLLDVFERRRLLIAYYFMWHTGHPAPEQCEGCTWVTSQVRELSYIHDRLRTAGDGEDSPTGWPRRFKGKQNIRTGGRPTAQWSRLQAGYSDDRGTGGR